MINFEEIFKSSLSIDNLKTLEDLRLFLEAEARKYKDERHLQETEKRLDGIINQFDLPDDEKIYVTKNLLSEEQSNIKTIINSTKAKEILLKRKK